MTNPLTVSYSRLVMSLQKTDNGAILFSDDKGRTHKKSLNATVARLLFSIVQERGRSIHRKTGGFISADIVKFIFCDGSDGLTHARVRVRFRDFLFHFAASGMTAECVYHNKVLSLQELHNQFGYDVQRSQNFVVDFGDGIVPIFVFHYKEDIDSKEAFAYFLEMDDIDRLLRGRKEFQLLVQVYRLPKSALRFASDECDSENISDFELAWQNYHHLKNKLAIVIPNCFQFGASIVVDPAPTVDILREQLLNALERIGSPYSAATFRSSDNQHMPHGGSE